MFSFAKFGNDLYTGRRSFDFIGRWKTWVSIGIVLCLASFALLGTVGLNPGIEFRGGSEFRVTGTSQLDESIAEEVVTRLVPDAEAPRASVIGTDSVRVQTGHLSEDQTTELRQDLATAYDVDPSAVTSFFVGPSWGADITVKAVTGLLIFLGLVTLVIALYFRTFAMAFAALIALLHDLIVTAGVYAATGFEVTPATVIGFLTILGYSLYDTVVVFDKVRENTEHVLSSTKRSYAEETNLAVNQTLVRSINTSVVALLPVGSILFIGAFLLGAGTLRDISLSLFVGIIAGTYSSVFIAPPLLVLFRHRDPRILAQAERVARRREAEAKAGAGAVPAAAVAAAGGSTSGGGGTAVLTRDVEPGAASTDEAPTGATRPPRPGGPRNQPRRGNRKRPGGKKR